MPTGAQLFVESLMTLGVREIFTLVGDHLNAALSYAASRGLRIIDVRHESGAVHAADIVGRQRRTPAVSLVTGGPGHTNSLTGIATAYAAGSPLIAVSGAAATGPAGRQVFQVIDQVGMAAPVVKWSAQPASAAQIPYLMRRAWMEAISGRMGPVHLSIPVDVFTAEAAAPLPAHPPALRPAPYPGVDDVERAIRLLRQAKRPIVIAGSGVWWADAGEELRRFLQLTKLPYYSITMARGVVPDDYDYSMGYADPALNRAVLKSFPEADVVLILGKRLDSRMALGGPALFTPQAKIIQVDIHAPELGNTRQLDLGICADARSTLEMLNGALGRTEWVERADWLEQIRQHRDEWQAQVAASASDRSLPIHPAAAFAAIRDQVSECLYAWDGGNFVHWGRVVLPARRPGGWVRLGPMATIGAGLPNAIGLQLANPTERVLMITGDGSLGFYIAELDTLVRHNLPVVILVGNDAGWGVERDLQGASEGTAVGCELRPTRYDLVMKAFGGEGENIISLDELPPALARAFAAHKPYLLNVNIRAIRSPFTEWVIGRKKSA